MKPFLDVKKFVLSCSLLLGALSAHAQPSAVQIVPMDNGEVQITIENLDTKQMPRINTLMRNEDNLLVFTNIKREFLKESTPRYVLINFAIKDRNQPFNTEFEVDVRHLNTPINNYSLDDQALLLEINPEIRGYVGVLNNDGVYTLQLISKDRSKLASHNRKLSLSFSEISLKTVFNILTHFLEKTIYEDVYIVSNEKFNIELIDIPIDELFDIIAGLAHFDIVEHDNAIYIDVKK